MYIIGREAIITEITSTQYCITTLAVTADSELDLFSLFQTWSGYHELKERQGIDWLKGEKIEIY
jgi:hypothetical protein